MPQLFYLPDPTPADHRRSPVKNVTGDPNSASLPLDTTPPITEITGITSKKNRSTVQETRALYGEEVQGAVREGDIEEKRARAQDVYRGHVVRAPVIGDLAGYAKPLPLENDPIAGQIPPVILPVITGDLAQRGALPRALWRRDLTSHADAWRHYEAMCAAGYQVCLVGRAVPEQWDVCAPVAAAATPPALPTELARDFVTFVEAWRYWGSLAGYARALWRDEARSCYHVGPPRAGRDHFERGGSDVYDTHGV